MNDSDECPENLVAPIGDSCPIVSLCSRFGKTVPQIQLAVTAKTAVYKYNVVYLNLMSYCIL
jgi:hypothetical protein